MDTIKAGLYREQKIIKAGTKNFGDTERPVFTIMNLTKITYVFPRWYRRLREMKRIDSHRVEFQLRALKIKLDKIDLLLGDYSLYENPYMIVRSAFDGHPRDAKEALKVQLRLFNKAIHEFLDVFKPEVINYLIEYKLINNKLVFCPAGPRKGLKSS